MKRMICIFSAVLLAAIAVMSQFAGKEQEKSYIKYVEFNVTKEALRAAIDFDIANNEEDNGVDYISLLAYLGAKYGGDFSRYKYSDMCDFVDKLKSGESVEELTREIQYFRYYREAYTAAIGDMVGYFDEEHYNENGELVSDTKYGIKWFLPIAKTFPYSAYDDFGAQRTYGYTRPHLGHDMMSATGTPVIAVESGTIEMLGWNQYGGWRIGIRSFDKKRYWYYAHLRKDSPYAADFSEGDVVTAGDVIGYVGRTGYSRTENVNGIDESHLHIGLELVFDESQKESQNEIWISLNAITQVLTAHQSAVIKDENNKEFVRQYKFSER